MKIELRLANAIIKRLEIKNQLAELQSEATRTEERGSDLINMPKNGVVHSGSRVHGNYESGDSWFVFKGTMTDAEISSACARLDIPIGGDRDRGVFDDNDWDCSGKTLVDQAHIKRTKTRVLVTQHWYVDV